MKKHMLTALLAEIQNGRAAVLATVTRAAAHEIGAQLLFLANGEIVGSEENIAPLTTLRAQAQNMLGEDRSEVLRFDDREIFLESYCPAPTLVVIGAVHIAIPLVTFAKELGYKTVLVDPRRAFATPQRFRHVDQLLSLWPEQALAQIGIDASTCVVVLTHDPKLDDPAVKFALRHSPAYIGVLGSRKTHEKRLQRLQRDGVPAEHLKRLHAPIGIAIGGRSPAEIALSIMAEIIAVRRHPPEKSDSPQNPHLHEHFF